MCLRPRDDFRVTSSFREYQTTQSEGTLRQVVTKHRRIHVPTVFRRRDTTVLRLDSLRALARRHPASVGFAAGILVCAVAGTTTAAVAAIPDGAGKITACVSVGGVTRIIDTEAGGTCATTERRVTWSQAGPQGISGPAGASGAQGPKGDPGPAGTGVGRQLADWTFEESASFGTTQARTPEDDHAQLLWSGTVTMPAEGFVTAYVTSGISRSPGATCQDQQYEGMFYLQIGEPNQPRTMWVTLSEVYINFPNPYGPFGAGDVQGYLPAGVSDARLYYRPAACTTSTSGDAILDGRVLLVRQGL